MRMLGSTTWVMKGGVSHSIPKAETAPNTRKVIMLKIRHRFFIVFSFSSQIYFGNTILVITSISLVELAGPMPMALTL